MRIGLLGGSFNPAHAGHLHVSLWAMKALGLNEVWWLVSPQNPLKSRDGMAEHALRVSHAREITKKHPRIKVKTLEAEQGLYYTVETLRYLLGSMKQRAHPSKARRGAAGGAKRWGQGPHQYLWLMGADNLAQFHRWKGWREIVAQVPIAVFERDHQLHRAVRGKAAIVLAKTRKSTKNLGTPPGWCLLAMPRRPESATHLRKTLGKKAFLGHNGDS
jgi:nicotinate-nucleotide adenylyltransferase